MSGVDWNFVSEKMARQILAQGELHLQSQQALAIAADQRASTAASILASAATAIAAVSIAFWDKSADRAALLGGITGAVVLMVAAAMAAYSARPTDFHSPGNHPAQWFPNRKSGIVGMIGGEAESVQRRIDKNAEIMAENQDWLRRGFYAAMGAPLAALVVWLTASSLSWLVEGLRACLAG